MEDLRELLELLNSEGVDYLIIGAHALAHHGFPRATKDIDIWAGRSMENAERLAEALREFGADLGPGGPTEFADEKQKMIRLGVPPNMVDILNFAGADKFEDVWNRRVEGQLFGVKVHYPSKAALIEMKRTAGRPQDLVDLEKLESSS